MKDYLLKGLCALQADRRGITALEYAVIAGVLVLAIATAFTGLATKIGTVLTSVENAMG